MHWLISDEQDDRKLDFYVEKVETELQLPEEVLDDLGFILIFKPKPSNPWLESLLTHWLSSAASQEQRRGRL